MCPGARGSEAVSARESKGAMAGHSRRPRHVYTTVDGAAPLSLFGQPGSPSLPPPWAPPPRPPRRWRRWAQPSMHSRPPLPSPPTTARRGRTRTTAGGGGVKPVTTAAHRPTTPACRWRCQAGGGQEHAVPPTRPPPPPLSSPRTPPFFPQLKSASGDAGATGRSLRPAGCRRHPPQPTRPAAGRPGWQCHPRSMGGGTPVTRCVPPPGRACAGREAPLPPAQPPASYLDPSVIRHGISVPGARRPSSAVTAARRGGFGAPPGPSRLAAATLGSRTAQRRRNPAVRIHAGPRGCAYANARAPTASRTAAATLSGACLVLGFPVADRAWSGGGGGETGGGTPNCEYGTPSLASGSPRPQIGPSHRTERVLLGSRGGGRAACSVHPTHPA